MYLYKSSPLGGNSICFWYCLISLIERGVSPPPACGLYYINGAASGNHKTPSLNLSHGFVLLNPAVKLNKPRTGFSFQMYAGNRT